MADAPALGAGDRKVVGVRLPSRALFAYRHPAPSVIPSMRGISRCRPRRANLTTTNRHPELGNRHPEHARNLSLPAATLHPGNPRSPVERAIEVHSRAARSSLSSRYGRDDANAWCAVIRRTLFQVTDLYKKPEPVS